MSNTFLVYDSQSFARLEDVQVEVESGEEMNALDIAACSRNHCLYVSDSNNFCCVLRLRRDHELAAGDGREVVKWLDGLNGVKF